MPYACGIDGIDLVFPYLLLGCDGLYPHDIHVQCHASTVLASPCQSSPFLDSRDSELRAQSSTSICKYNSRFIGYRYTNISIPQPPALDPPVHCPSAHPYAPFSPLRTLSQPLVTTNILLCLSRLLRLLRLLRFLFRLLPRQPSASTTAHQRRARSQISTPMPRHAILLTARPTTLNIPFNAIPNICIPIYRYRLSACGLRVSLDLLLEPGLQR